MSSLPATSTPLEQSSPTLSSSNNQQQQPHQQPRPTISISTSNSPTTTSNSNISKNSNLKSFFLKIFHKNNSNELKRNQSFFDRFKRKKKLDHVSDIENHDISPSGASSLSLNDLPDVILVNDDDDNSSNDSNDIFKSTIEKNQVTKNGNEYLYLYNYNSSTLNIYNKYNGNENELKCKYEINDHTDDINCILNFDFNLFTGSHDNSINYYKITENGNLELIIKFQGETNTLESLSNYKKLHLISGSRDKIIRIRNLENFNELTKLEGHTSWVQCVYGGCDNSTDNINSLYESHLFSSQRSTNLNESDIYIWNIENGKIVQKLRGHESTVYKMTQINSLLVSASQDGSVKLWDLRCSTEQQQLVGDLRGHNDWVKDVRPYSTSGSSGSSSSNEIVSCSMDGSIKLWDIRKMSTLNNATTTDNTTSTTTSTSNHNNNNNQNHHQTSKNSALIETLHWNEEIGFTCIHPLYNSNYWYFGSNESGKLHVYDWKDRKLRDLNIDKDITIDGIC